MSIIKVMILPVIMRRGSRKTIGPLLALMLGASQPSVDAKDFGDFSMEIPSVQGWGEGPLETMPNSCKAWLRNPGQEEMILAFVLPGAEDIKASIEALTSRLASGVPEGGSWLERGEEELGGILFKKYLATSPDGVNIMQYVGGSESKVFHLMVGGGVQSPHIQTALKSFRPRRETAKEGGAETEPNVPAEIREVLEANPEDKIVKMGSLCDNTLLLDVVNSFPKEIQVQASKAERGVTVLPKGRPGVQVWRERWKVEGQHPVDFLFVEDGEGGTSFFGLQK